MAVIGIELIMLIGLRYAGVVVPNHPSSPRTLSCVWLLRRNSTDWSSPQQIVVRLKRTYPDNQEM